MRRSSALAFALFLVTLPVLAASSISVTTTAGSGAGSLADAVVQANSGACPSPCTIKFSVGGTFAITGFTVTANDLTVAGYSAPGASPNHGGFPQPNDAVITVNIVPNGTVNNAFAIQANGVTLEGVSISGFASDAILIDGTTVASSQNTVSGCVITNSGGGVRIQGALATNNLVGTGRPASNPVAGSGTGRPADRNVIGNNTKYDVAIADATNNAVAGCNLGVAGDGVTAAPSPKGVWILGTSSTNAVGGTSPGNTNVIGAHTDGIRIEGASGTLINGNWIGVNINGTGAVANTVGVHVVNATGATSIGALRANVISGNTTGVLIDGATGSTVVQGNLIGTDVSGTGVLGNSGYGVQTTGSAGNVVIQTNTIANNTAGGVAPGGAGVQIRANAIYANGGRAIDLTGGAAPVNDVGDADNGNNNLQNYPNASTVRLVTGVLMFDATVDSSLTANGSIALDVFKADPNGQARQYVGTTGCIAGNNLTLYPVSIPTGLLVAGDSIVTTATTYGNSSCSSPGDGTSELSAPAPLCAAPPAVLTVPSFLCAQSTGNVASVGATGGATYTWSVSNATITGGQGTTSITFTAGSAGTAVVQVIAAFGSCINPNSVSIPVRALPDVTISAPAEACAGSTGVSASVPVNPSATFLWSVTGGTLTSGQGTNSITFDVPAASSGVTLGVSATANSCANGSSANVTVDSVPAPVISAPSSMTASTSGSASVAANPSATFTWSITNGSITGGQGTSAITFTAGTGAQSVISVTETVNICSKSATANVTVIPPIVITTPSLPVGSVDSPYSLQFTATGGSGTISWSFANGTIPPNLLFTSGGLITGAPKVTFDGFIDVTATDGVRSNTKHFHLHIVSGLVVATTSLPDAGFGAPYSATVLAAGGTGPYTWTEDGLLPGGLTLNPDGTITGQAVSQGTFPFTVTVTDHNGTQAHGPLSITVGASLRIVTLFVPGATINTNYSFTFSAAGGTPFSSVSPYVWSLVAGSLPAGLGFSPDGTISGKPTTTDGALFTVRVTDAVGSAEQQFFISGSCGTPDLSPPKVSAVREVTTDQRYTVGWHDVAGASQYELQESTQPDFGDNPAPITFTTPGYQTRHHAEKPNAYYYRVRALSSCAGATSDWSRAIRVVIVPLPSPFDRPLHVTLPYGEADQVILSIFIPGSDNFNTPLAGTVTALAIVPVAPPPNGAYTAASTNPAMVSVSPTTGTIPPTGVMLTAVVGPASLPPGTTTAVVNVSNANTGALVASVPLSVSLTTPVLPLNSSAIAAQSLVIPAVAHIDGATASFASDLRVGNVSTKSTNYEVTFTPWGNGDQAQTTDFPIAAGTTVLLDDVVRHMFGFGSLPSDGQAGTLSIRRLDTNTDPRATVAWTHMYSGDSASRVGQFIPSTSLDKFAAIGQSLSLQQISQSSASRTNLGLIESTGNPVTLLATAFGSNGTKLGEFAINVGASEHIQINSILSNNGISAPDARLQLQVTSGTGRISAYASVVDNGSTDASLVSAVDPNRVSSNHYVIPGVAHTDSVAANWRSDVRIFNPSTSAVPLSLVFVQQNSSDQTTVPLTVGPGEIVALDDVVSKTFSASNAGALHVETDQPVPLVVTGRTYRNNAGGGTLGQFINAVTPDDVIGNGDRTLNMVGVEESQAMHTNLGVYETSGNPASAEVTVTTADGRASARFQLDLQPNEFRQLSSVLAQIGMSDEYNASIAVRVTAGTGRVGAYSSVVENASGDPLFVPAQ